MEAACVHQEICGRRRCEIPLNEYIWWDINQPLKEWNIAICRNMNELRGYHTEWSESDIERQIYDITYMWNAKNNAN